MAVLTWKLKSLLLYPVWPDWGKFSQSSTMLNNFGHFEWVNLAKKLTYFGKFYLQLGKFSLFKIAKY